MVSPPLGHYQQKNRQGRRPVAEDTSEDSITLERARDRAKPKGSRPAEPATGTEPPTKDPNARVVSPYGKLAYVQMENREILCRVDPKLIVGKSSILAPGDEIVVEYANDEPVVRSVGPRRSRLSRPVGKGGREQVIAANVDVLVAVASAAQPAFKHGLVDRYLVAAGVGDVEPVLCVNKMDLVDAEPPEVSTYRELGLGVFNTSCKTEVGLEKLRRFLEGKTSVLAGHSGVGKSSILNAFNPDFAIATREVSQAGQKGRHATATARMYQLGAGTRIIDTPGVRRLGLWGISPEELAFYFPEMDALAGECRFRNCTHTHEPDCAVRDALETGAIPRLRYESYLRIRSSL